MRHVLMWVLLASTVAAVALLAVRFSYDSGRDGDGRWSMVFDPSLSRFLGTDDSIGTSEDAAASAEHSNIISSILGCLKLEHFTDYESLPQRIKSQLVVPQRYTKRSVFATEESNGSLQRIPGYFRSITELSSLISDRRGQLAASMQKSRLLMQELQIAAIVIGIATTIIVGVKAGAANARNWDIAAIISAAIGTAIASLISFYNPREEYIRTARAISQLSQLQTTISFALGSEAACDSAAASNSKLLVDWYGSFSAISTASADFGGIESKQESKKD